MARFVISGMNFASFSVLLILFLQECHGVALTLFPRKFAHMSTGGRFKKKEFDYFAPVQNIWQRDNRRGDDVFTKNYVPRVKNNRTMTMAKYRLPLEVVPFHYILELTPILKAGSQLGEQWTAPGNIKILVECARASSSITMHAFLLKFPGDDAIKIRDLQTGEKVDVTNHEYSPDNEDFYVIKLGKELEPGHKYEIDISYIAPVSIKRLDGLYRSQYTDYKTGEKRYLASTQFEPYSARQAFPCFDEPALKATFDISIGRRREHISLSNGNLVSSVPMATTERGWFIDTFNTTVKMPTYTVAFLVADYAYTEAAPELFPGRPVRIYGPRAVIEKGGGEFSANVSAQALNFYEEYFEVPYPMQKMDSVAVPGFPYGAMENYGLNIYRDRYLIDIPGVTPESLRGSISNILAHELAHQWFGNLVTCEFWNNIWLNEGFATYFSYLGQNATNPEFQPMKKLLTDANQFAFRLDSRDKSSFSLLLDTEHPDELAKRFFGVPYYKGASLIRMMDGFLTTETLRAGISRYLKRWAFKAAIQDNLFDALQEQAVHDGIPLPANTTVGDIMRGWTKQRGFPVVRVVTTDKNVVTLIAVQNYIKKDKPQSVIVNGRDKLQEKTIADGEEEEFLSWTVPVSVATADNPNFNDHLPKLWMMQGDTVTSLEVDTSKWIVVNPDATAYFRVHYDDNLASLLKQQLNTDHSVISPLSRSQLLDDYFSYVVGEEIPVSTALEFTTYFGNETEEIVWNVLLQQLRRLHYFYREESSSKNGARRAVPRFQGFRDYLLPRFEGALQKIGVEQKPEDKGVVVGTRARLLSWACKMGSQLCLDYANEMFQKWMLKPENNPVPIDLQDFMYCYGVRAGGGRNWLFALDQYTKAPNLLQSLRLAKGLTCGDDEDVLNVFMDSVVDSKTEGVSKEEFLIMFESLSNNPSKRHLAAKFLQLKFPAILKYLNGTRSVNVLFDLLTDTMHTEEELAQVHTIYSENLPHILAQNDLVDIASHLDDIKENIKWMKKNYEPMREWFESQTKTESVSSGPSL